jgi:hypothetical protein
MESPVLFFRGTGPLELTKEQKENLKEYVNQGGFLFAEACDGDGCDGESFRQSFEDLMQELFPESPLRELPPDHAVWFAEVCLSELASQELGRLSVDPTEKDDPTIELRAS